jgi:hypothetical protein
MRVELARLTDAQLQGKGDTSRKQAGSARFFAESGEICDRRARRLLLRDYKIVSN